MIETLKSNGITPFAFANLEQFHFLHMAWAAIHASVPPDRVKDWYYMRDPSVKLTDPDFVRGLAWLPVIRVVGDLAKMAGYPVGVWRRARSAKLPA